MKRAFLNKIFIIALGFGLTMFLMPRPFADENTSQAGDVINMVTGDIETVPVNSLTRVSVTNPDIADISDAQSDKVSVLAKKSGETVLFLWDAGGKRSVKVRVVSEDLSVVKARVQKLLNEANITDVSLEENLNEGKVVVSGAVSKEDKSRLENILQPYNDNLLNLVKEEKNEDLIQVDMQIVEISTSFEKDLGILWGSSVTASTGSGSTSTTPGLTTETENLPSTNGNGKFKDFFKVGGFARTPLQATINAFIQEGKARLISKPRLVALNGKQASFLVGGEIPVLNTTTNATGTSSTQSTTYTQYGVNVTVTPTIREGKIDILLNVDIRDIDASNSSTANGTAFITRTASTDLFMDNKQTIALAGLIKYTDNETVTGIPILSKIPIVGALFRNRQTPAPDTNTEMVIILTPTVLTDKKFADNQLVMPTPLERDSWKEISAKYEHEPLSSSWPVAKGPSVDVNKVQPEYLPVMTAYARMVQEKISKAISYPNAVGAGGVALAGTVKLKLRILKNGSLDSAEVMESSGNYILDQDAMQAAKTAAPFDAFTTGMDQEGIVFTIPIVYNNLIAGSAQAPAEKVIASY
jgi:pilus assembly protein CpaC